MLGFFSALALAALMVEVASFIVAMLARLVIGRR